MFEADDFKPIVKRDSNQLEKGKINRDSGPFEAIVTNVLDPNYGGSLEVELIRSVDGGNPIRSGQKTFVKYLYPFYGTTSEKGLTSNPGYKASQQSYGMWMVPPDVGNMVLVIFVEGQLNNGYWIGCVQQELMNFMVPDGRTATRNIDGTNVEKKKLPVGEHNKIRMAFNKPGHPVREYVRLPKPVNSDFKTVLETQGLLEDETRGITTSSARREVPSAVFGINTPGPKDKKHRDSLDGRPHSRLGGSSFVMDDGDDKFIRKTNASEGHSEYINIERGDQPSTGKVDVPHNELTRIRTRTGHQLLFHNSEDLIYIGNANGTSWVELSSDGKVDVFAEDSISFHTKNDFNLTADRDVTIEAGGNINLKASGQYAGDKTLKGPLKDDGSLEKLGRIQLESNAETSLLVGNGMYITTTGNFEAHTTGDMLVTTLGELDINTTQTTKITSGENFEVLSVIDNKLTAESGNTHIHTDLETKITSGGTSHIKSGGDHIETASNIHMNGPAAAEAGLALEAEKSLEVVPLTTHKLPGHEENPILVQRSPQHEPWNQHENLNPLAFKTTLTDRDAFEKEEGAITVTNDKDLTPIPDTFLNTSTKGSSY